MLRMNFYGAQDMSLRLDQLETSRLVRAFVLSVAVHLLAWGTYETGKKFHVWDKIHAPAWMKALALPLPKAVKKETPEERQPPLVFINVSPEQAVTEAPKNATYYSSRSSVAANPEADHNTDTPKIAGTQMQVPKTEDVPREQFEKLQPALPAPQPEPEVKAKPTMAPGDLTMAKPDLNVRTETGDAERPRPRTLKEAYARKHMNQPPGRKMKQDGGVARRANLAMVDARGTSFGAYDEAFIAAVSQRWYDLLDNIRYDGYQPGKVVLQFHLNYDGRITEMKVAESTVGDMLSILCRKAVEDPAPYEKWPSEMRLKMGRDMRPIQFTFYYN